MTTKILTVGADASLQTAIAETLSLDPLLGQGNRSEGNANPSNAPVKFGMDKLGMDKLGMDKLGMEEKSGDDRFELVFAPDTTLATLQKLSSDPPQLIICHLEGCCSDLKTSSRASGSSLASPSPNGHHPSADHQPRWQMLLNHWRQNAATAQVPIILLAASQNIPSARQGMELGADDYLLTPISPKVLLKAIQARLRRKANLENQQQQTQLLAQALKNELSALQSKLKDVQRAEAVKSKLLKRAAQDLREPLANINMALHLLKGAGCEVERDRYISVLESECVRELSLLDDLSNVQTLLTPDNTSLLQKFQVLANS